MRLGPNDTVLCTGTVRDATFAEKAAAAAAAGFTAISLRPTEYLDSLAGGLSPADFKAILTNYGLQVAELDPVMTWVPAPVPAARNALPVDEVLAIAEVVEPHCLSVLVDWSYRGALDDLIAPFAALCATAAARGLICAVEFFAFSPLRTLAATWRLVTEAAAANAGIIFDNWHHTRLGGTDADLALVDARRIVGVQLSDLTAAPEHAALQRECMAERRWPGEGAANPGATVRALRAGGCRAPLGIEVFGAGNPTERAVRAAATLRAVAR